MNLKDKIIDALTYRFPAMIKPLEKFPFNGVTNAAAQTLSGSQSSPAQGNPVVLAVVPVGDLVAIQMKGTSLITGGDDEGWFSISGTAVFRRPDEEAVTRHDFAIMVTPSQMRGTIVPLLVESLYHINDSKLDAQFYVEFLPSSEKVVTGFEFHLADNVFKLEYTSTYKAEVRLSSSK